MTKFTLTNGKLVQKPFNRIWIILAVLLILIIIFWQFIFLPEALTLDQLGDVLVAMFTPRNDILAHRTWSDYFGYILELVPRLVLTLKMAFAGSILGSLIAFPVAVLAAKNITKNKWIYGPFKFIMNIIRTVPAVIMVVLGSYFVGIGVLAAIIGFTLFSFGIMAKMLYEIIETTDMNPFEALESTGANKIQAFRYAVLPQILPIFISYLIYVFEINIRASIILGYVGVECIGSAIYENVLFNYDRVGATVILLFFVIVIIQVFSSWARGKLE